MFAAALKVKTSYMCTMSSANHISDQIQSAPEWRWANNKENKGALDDAIVKMRNQLSPMHKDFLALEAGLIKKQYSKAYLEVNLSRFIEMKTHIAGINKRITSLQRMHQLACETAD